MRIAVLIKQVPMMAKMEFDPQSKTLKRDGVPTEVSSFDLRALIKAVELAQAHGGETVAVTMGPPQAEEALVECLALGADRAVHLCDKAFAGSDTLATARALAAALRREPFDLVLCGRHSVDAETGQVGPEIAELLDLPQVTAARILEIDPQRDRLRAEREIDDGFETVETTLPAVVSAAEDLAPEKFSNKAEREAAKQKKIETLCAADLGLAPSQLGWEGSPTEVVGLETVTVDRRREILEGESVQQAIDRLVERLLEHGLFGEWKVEAQRRPASDAPVKRAGAADVWVVAERMGERLRPVTFELLGKATDLARRLGSRVTAVLLSADGRALVEPLGRRGADRVLLARAPRFAHPDTELAAAVLADVIRRYRPGIVLLPSTVAGRDVAPRVAARLGLGLTGDCIDLDLDGDGRLLQYKPAFGGNVVAPILSKTLPEMATVRPGFLQAHEPEERAAEVELVDVPNGRGPRVHTVARAAITETAAALDDAEIVIGVGKGFGSRDNLAAVDPLVRLLDAAVCATREVTDAGWLPKQFQVGLTGRAVAPKLYIGIAVRGAMEHMVGLRRAGIVVGINKNPKAPLFKTADYGIVGDYAEVVPALAARLAEAKG